MGIIDDLAMGLGMKARTEDYDARTARTIARNEGTDVGQSRAAQQYLGGRGYAEGYTPQVAQDNRSFFQRLFTSLEDRQSPTPYAAGPISMDKPLSFGALSALSPMGMLFRALSGGRQQAQAPQDPRVTEAIAALRNPTNSTANRGGGILPKPKPTNMADADIVDVQSLDEGLGLLYSTNPMFDNQRNMASFLMPYEGMSVNPDDIKISRIDDLATGPEYSGKYPEAAYADGYDDIYLDSLKSRDPENFAFVMRNYGVEGY